MADRSPWIALGVQLGLRTGFVGRVRSLCVALVVAMIGVIVLTVCAIPGAAQVRADREAARSAVPVPGAGLENLSDPASTRGGVVVDRSYEPIDHRTIQVVRIAAHNDGPASPPPGVVRLPVPGEAVVSPALERYVTAGDHGGLHDRLGSVIGAVGPSGLLRPDELIAYIGVERAELDPMLRRDPARIGAPAPDRLGRAWVWVGGVLGLVSLPAATVLTAALRLSATTQHRRLRALRGMGATRRELSFVVLGATLPAAILGLMLGVLAFQVGASALADVGLAGHRWFPADVRSGWSALPTLAFLGAVLRRATVQTARSAALAPEATGSPRREGTSDRGRLLGALLLTAPLAGIAVAGRSTVVLDGLELSGHLFVGHLAGLVGAFAALVIAAPAAARMTGARLRDRASRPAWHLSGAAMAAHPSAAARAAAMVGIAVLVGATGTAYASAADESASHWVRSPPGGLVVEQVSNPQLDDALVLALGSDRVLALHSFDVTDPSDAFPSRVVVASCEAVEAMDGRIAGCRAGATTYRLPMGRERGPVPFVVDGHEVVAPAPQAALDVPVAANRSIGPVDGDYLVEPSALGVDLAEVVPDAIQIAGDDAETVELVRSVLAREDSAATFADEHLFRERFRSEHPVDRRAASVAVVAPWAILLGGVGIAVLDQAFGRRRTQAALLAMGVDRGVRARALALATAVPGAVTLAGTAALAVLADLSWSRVIHRPPMVTWQPLVLIGIGAILVSLASALAAWLATRSMGGMQQRREQYLSVRPDRGPGRATSAA